MDVQEVVAQEALLRGGRDTSQGLADALATAAWRGDLAELDILLEAGAEPNSKRMNGSWGALHLAVENESVDCLARLLERGGDPNLRDGLGVTLLHHAVELEVDAAHQATAPLTSVLTAVLLRFGADPTQRNNDGISARELAEELGHEEAVRLFEVKRRGLDA